MDRIKQWFIEMSIWVLELAMTVPCMMLTLWAAMIVFMQSGHWLQHGEWMPVPATAFFYHQPFDFPWVIEKLIPDLHALEFSKWLQRPSTALGPHKVISAILNWISIPAFLLMIAGFYWWLWLVVLHEIEAFKK